jgi:hypothetical protein
MGRFNLIDAAVALLVAAVIPAALVAYRVLRVPLPLMLAVTPATVSANGPLEIRVTGEHFRPFLRAYVSKTGARLTADDLPQDQRAGYLIQTRSAVELKLPPDLRPGSYDLYLYDEGRELAHLAPAFTLTAPAPVVEAPKPSAVLSVGLRVTVEPDLLPLIKVGDTDLNQPENGPPAHVAAVLTSWQPFSGTRGPRTLRFDNRVSLSPAATLPVFDAEVRLGAVRRDRLWEYSGPQPIRVGEQFWFATSAYIVHGVITRVTPARSVSTDSTSR